MGHADGEFRSNRGSPKWITLIHYRYNYCRAENHGELMPLDKDTYAKLNISHSGFCIQAH